MLKHVKRVRGYYYWRKRVPADLYHVFNHRELKISLHTADRKTAKSAREHYTHEYKKLVNLIRSHIMDTDEVIRQILDNPDQSVRSILLGGRSPAKKDTSKPTNPLSRVIQSLIKEKTSCKGWNSQNLYETQRTYQQFLEIMGDRDVSHYSRDDLVSYVESLKKLPKNVNKITELKGKSITEVLSMDHDYPRLDATTINMRLTRINSLFIYAKRQGYISINPSEALTVKDDTLPQDEREPYSTEDIQNWFNTPFYKDKEEIAKHPDRFWIPLIMLFNGCRPSEVCQLTKKDIIRVEGIDCVSINPDNGKSIKTKSSKRIIPIHPFLLQVDFLDYVNTVEDNLFSIRKYKNTSISKDFNKWADAHNRKYVSNNPKKVPYSFRHTFTDNLKQAGVSREITDELTGHVVEGESFGRYGKRYLISTLLDAVQKVNYNVDLNHLKLGIERRGFNTPSK